MIKMREHFREVLDMAVFCHRCGTGLPNTARFCSNCGNVIFSAPPMQGRPLVRPLAGRNIAGVCIGLAQAYGWDVGVVRILTVLGFFFSGGVIGVAYLAGWIGIPEEPIAIPGTYPPNTGANTGGVSS
jgi:phage shock protein C